MADKTIDPDMLGMSDLAQDLQGTAEHPSGEDPNAAGVESLALEAATDKPELKASFVQQKVGSLTFAGIPMATVTSIKPFINCMIYGPPGAGKTHLIGTAASSPHLKDLLYINAEAGANTLLKFKEDIMVVPDPMVQSGITWEQFEAVYDELDRQCYNSKDKPDFASVCIDTGTE